MTRGPSAGGAALPRRARRLSVLVGIALTVGACSSHADDPRTVTADDQRQLNEAAAMLDANSVDANAVGAHESSPHD